MGMHTPDLKRSAVLTILLAALLAAAPVAAGGYIQAAGLIDTRTTFSDGAYPPAALARLAAEKGFDVLFFNDHDRMALAYGVPPFRHILKRKVERRSINKIGADEYLRAISQAGRKSDAPILIPGSETVPFYYWQGSLLKKNLTAHDHEKRLLTVGMENPADYRDLPILHNGFSTRHLKASVPGLVIFTLALVLGLVLLKEKRFYRLAGGVIAALSLLCLLNLDPFRSSPYDAYHGDRGIAPYQLVIDYVNSRNGLTFWNYPETRSGVRKLGPIHLNTPPYPDALEQATGYTGFAAIYGDTITLTEPGKQWDRILTAYCRGERARPAWGIATADFHTEGGAQQQLGDFPTVFLVPRKTKSDILAAMRQGRMYACQSKFPQRLVLNDFSVCSPDGRTCAVMGEEIRLAAPPRIHIDLALRQPAAERVEIRLIRSGRLIQKFSGSLPMKIDFQDPDPVPGQKMYYRIDVRGHGTLVANPIFVTVQPRG